MGIKSRAVCCFVFMSLFSQGSFSMGLPAAGWHRGDVSVAQENSRAAITSALYSRSPNFECDVTDFKDTDGKRIGIVTHDYTMKRSTGKEGTFNRYHDVSKLPLNITNVNQPPEPFITVIELFEMIKRRKSDGICPIVSLDLKDEGDEAEQFGEWLGRLILEYGFQEHVFSSSFFKSNVAGVKSACPQCLVGGLVYDDHYVLRWLDQRYTSLDLTLISKLTFFMGHWFKDEYPHNFVLLQDDIYFSHPELVAYWKDIRKVRFVGVFVHDKEAGYTEDEWRLLRMVDWLELDPPQMEQYLKQQKSSDGY